MRFEASWWTFRFSQPSYSSPWFQWFIEFLGIQSWEDSWEVFAFHPAYFDFHSVQNKQMFLIIFAGSCDIDLWSSPVCHYGTCRTQLDNTSGAAPAHSRRGRSHDAFCYLHQIYHVQVSNILRTAWRGLVCGIYCNLHCFRKVNDSEPISLFFLFGCLQEVPTINANDGCRRNFGEWILICALHLQIQGWNSICSYLIKSWWNLCASVTTAENWRIPLRSELWDISSLSRKKQNPSFCFHFEARAVIAKGFKSNVVLPVAQTDACPSWRHGKWLLDTATRSRICWNQHLLLHWVIKTSGPFSPFSCWEEVDLSKIY